MTDSADRSRRQCKGKEDLKMISKCDGLCNWQEWSHHLLTQGKLQKNRFVGGIKSGFQHELGVRMYISEVRAKH